MKPSERIKEIYKTQPKSHIETEDIHYCLKSIMCYLDEVYEEEQKALKKLSEDLNKDI